MGLLIGTSKRRKASFYNQLNTQTKGTLLNKAFNLKKILNSLFFFFLAGLCEIGGGYLV